MFGSFKALKRLKELEERLEKLERAHKQVALEWEDAYEKFTRIVQRITKRAQVVAAAETEAQTETEDDQDSGTGLVLSERQRKIQASILTQRGRRNGLLPG